MLPTTFGGRLSPLLLLSRNGSRALGRRACSSGSGAGVAYAKRSPIPNDGKTLADFLPGAPSELASTASSLKVQTARKPAWLKMYNPNLTTEGAERYKHVRSTVKASGSATVCQEAKCPNIGECWSTGTATVMIMGDTCTRGCRFCSVATSRKPPPPDPAEPVKVAKAVGSWGVDYIVLTMVDRDDLPDQGAAHIVSTVRELKQRDPKLGVETLVGDFQGRLDLVGEVAQSGMDVFAHNIETVARLQRTVRDRRAGYEQTLAVLRHAKKVRPDVVTKSSLMLGLGEEPEEIHQAMIDLQAAGVEIVTFGQYLQPTRRHMKVTRYVTPAEFDEWKKKGEDMGLHVASGPLVRSSYRAGEFYKERLARRAEAPASMLLDSCASTPSSSATGTRPASIADAWTRLSYGDAVAAAQ